MKNDLRSKQVSLLGTGLIGEFYTRALLGAGKQIGMVYSRDTERARAFAGQWNIPRSSGDLRQAIADPETGVVIIGLPDQIHQEAVELAAAAGKAILCTKPLARTAQEAREILEMVATPPAASTTCTGGTLTAVAGAGVISYSGGTVSPGASCTVTVDVTSSTPGPHPNTSGNLTSSLGDSGSASDTLTVNPLLGQLTVTKVPDLLTVVQGGTVTFTITIENTGVNNLVNITVVDPMTPSCNQAAGALANLGPGESHSYTCVTDPLDVTFTNEVTVTAELANPPNGLSTLTGPVQVTAVATATVVVTASDIIPTLSDLGLLILLLLLAGSGYLLLRRRLDG